MLDRRFEQPKHTQEEEEANTIKHFLKVCMKEVYIYADARARNGERKEGEKG